MRTSLLAALLVSSLAACDEPQPSHQPGPPVEAPPAVAPTEIPAESAGIVVPPPADTPATSPGMPDSTAAPR